MKAGYAQKTLSGKTALRALFAAVCLFLAPACEGGAEEPRTPMTLLILGDSLSAGYGLSPEEGFGAQLQRALIEAGEPVLVRNASVSGETTGGARARLDWVLEEGEAHVVIVELGANDMLRGLNPSHAGANLDAILTRLGKEGAVVLLAGMRAPLNMDKRYRTGFDALFKRLAEKHNAVLYPFFLEGVALQRRLNLPDRLHPNARGVARIVEGIFPYLEKTLARARAQQKELEDGAS